VSYEGLWEIPIEAQLGLDNETVCSLFDDKKCWDQIETADDVVKYLTSNFERHFAQGSSPFPLFGHLLNLIGAENVAKKQGK